MTIDWQKLLSALGDFVTIMMPGMILMFVLAVSFSESTAFAPFFVSGRFSVSDSTESILKFAVTSYLLGHIVFLVGSFLDDWVYDPVRKKTRLHYVRTLAKGETPEFYGIAAWLSQKMFKQDPDGAVAAAESLKATTLGAAKNSVNAYKWSRIRLLHEHPDGYASVARFEADSKFFRSLTVIMPAVILACFCVGRPLLASLAAAVTPLVVWRYCEQRFKATEEAYTQVISLDAKKFQANDGTYKASLAGAVVFDKEQDGPFRYLLVQARSKPDEWVLPKGHIEPGETPRETAVRETVEETGTWARVIRHLSDVQFPESSEVPVAFYLLERVVLRTKPPGAKKGPAVPPVLWPEDREHVWLSLGEALGRARFDETKKLLRDAAEKISDPAYAEWLAHRRQ